VLGLHPEIAPFKYAIMPLSKKENLIKMATDIFNQIVPLTSVDFDVAGSIGAYI
jgi:glycyl-tRNA synthetase